MEGNKLNSSTTSLISNKSGTGSGIHFSIKEDITLKDSNASERTIYQAGQEDKTIPKSIKFIIGTEICERFSFYGIRTILVIYLTSYMGYYDNTATTILHSFNFVSYFLPIIGAHLGDSVLGKYKTILYFSLLYSLGGIFLALSAIPEVVPLYSGINNDINNGTSSDSGILGSSQENYGPNGDRSPWALIIGLLMVAIGTGGIKPVISTFIGDQLSNKQTSQLQKLYQIFYWFINLGALAATFLSPILHTYVSWWLAFGLPSILIITSTIVFVIGSNSYRKRPITYSILVLSVKIIATGIYQEIKSLKDDTSMHGNHHNHWLDRVKSRYDSRLVDSVKAALNAMFCFIPLPFFFAMYDQSSSRWTLQAKSMDRQITSSFSIPPDQLQALNPLLVMLFIPIIENVVYRPLRNRGIAFHPLKRMCVGMLLSIISFLMAAYLQVVMDRNEVNSISVLLQIPQYLVMCWAEILISISGLEFAYSMAPSNMKCIIMSGWLWSIAFGNLFVVIVVDGISLARQWHEFVLFAAVMTFFTIVFIVIVARFKPTDPALLAHTEDNSDDEEEGISRMTDQDDDDSVRLHHSNNNNSSSCIISDTNNNEHHTSLYESGIIDQNNALLESYQNS